MLFAEVTKKYERMLQDRNAFVKNLTEEPDIKGASSLPHT